MRLKVTCACGKRFVAGDHLAGKRVRCPECGGALTIPAQEETGTSQPSRAKRDAPSDAESPAHEALSQAPKQAPRPVEPAPQAPETQYALSSDVWKPPAQAPAPPPPREEYALLPAAPRAVVKAFIPPAEPAANVCPDCGNTLADNAVICVACGLDLRSGKKLKPHSVDDGGEERRPRRAKPDRR